MMVGTKASTYHFRFGLRLFVEILTLIFLPLVGPLSCW